MPDLILLGLLMAAIAIGFWLGRRDRRPTTQTPAPATLSRDYFVGLNHLLNEQPDRAIETFVQALEVNSDTVDTHIALGNLYRSRGEVDRAVKIHQNLLARPALDSEQGERVQLELARDFMRSGVYDRAEKLLETLLKQAQHDDHRRAGRRLLIDLLEREREWEAALEVAHPILRQEGGIRRAAAHWHCELAALDILEGSQAVARKRLKQALSTDEKCVRANWMLAEIEYEHANYKQSIRLLQRIPRQDTGFTPIILEPLGKAFHMLDDESGLVRYLQQEVERGPYTTTVVSLAQLIERREGVEAAVSFASEQLHRHPSLRGVDYLLDLYLLDADERETQRFSLLKRHTQQLIEARPRHRCHRCGFEASMLLWQCPKCRHWGTVKPITGLEGE
ncbi:lipopolysaccharide assembly protein LapB [Cobetia marina]|jgi:lipopolysaccharide biosynthesis regulator YciM|uniref:Lipopolysaccharide assembly protein B n=1 Tax=Cobetia marina TaxID=28258 RepID=A0ABU9GK23_COBMA|nr:MULTISPECIES: lipopolysaccharide assembly protein LapB [Cobetia]AOM00793.1 lipopolysaccharide assembly protein LapB [Cobetia marina]AZV30865.1 lipopolysaccharide assembly protein LapB [Cobetia sp. ICG0124]MDA5562731.1 lipopolysaccharide assembly protein LapB [Cobetia sp. MMG027]MDH2290893.1 lipopolysaccharide assembly protein LapB [Cobetia sp. 10Alg 146]MDH2374911.1 lipopolysaccharide assembly protein LapB [Cobetia sp. 3AK]